MPQTKRQIEAILAAAGLRPNRRLGQNFLIDGNLMHKLVDSADISPRDVVLEVGAGTGSLTEMLLERAGRVVAVEVDRDLVPILQSRLGANPALTLVATDALADKHHLAPELIDAVREARRVCGGALRLVANLPYAVASPLLVDLVVSDLGVTCLCFTVQKEVGDRITAAPGGRDYGPLTVALQALCDARTITHLSASVFWPRPKIASTMLRLDANPAKAARIADLPHFTHVVRTCFLHRRKKLAHALAYLFGDKRTAIPASLEAFDLDRRPEQLSIDEWIALAAAVRTAAP